MPNRTSQAQDAAGTNWTSPALAKANGDGSAVFPANTQANDWLVLSNLSTRNYAADDTILGVEVQVVASGNRTTFTTVDGSGFGKGYQGSGSNAQNLSAHTEDALNAIDGVNATYFGGGSSVSASVIHDLLTAQSCGCCDLIAGCAGSAVAPVLHYSNNGTTWAAVTWTASGPGVISTSATPTTFSGAFTAVSARYWRLSILNSQSPKIYKFELWSGIAGVPLD